MKTNTNLRNGLIAIALSLSLSTNAQHWWLGGNSSFPLVDALNTSNNVLGSQAGFNIPIRIQTNGIDRLQFTTNNTFGTGGTSGDGIRIFDPAGGPGNLDLWTSSSTQTHIRWDGSGLIQGINARFEMIGNYNGLWFNAGQNTSRYIFNSLGTEHARVGLNNFWRIGANGAALDAHRRLEVLDNTGPQLRLAHTSIANINLGIWSDLQTTAAGHLFINPRNGNTGGNVGINTALPSSRLHVNSDASFATFLQLTNQSSTGETATDGLQIGIPATAANNMPAIISQKENDRIELRTNDENGAGERMRITHINGWNNGVSFNPGSLTTNLTRIGISHDPASPVTRPLSLLHLGYNTQSLLGNENGWRPWMDVGMYVSQESDNVYLGLKKEGEDRADAVISWGDNQANAGTFGAGPDNFRMIFTSTPFVLGGGTAPATSTNGLEGMRMTPTQTSGIFTGVGGDPVANPYSPTNSSPNPTATLEVNGWGDATTTTTAGGNSGLRFTNLNTSTPPIPNPGMGVLAVDANGDVKYVEAGVTGPPIGNYCPDPQRPLTDHFEIPLNGNSYSFTAPAGVADASTVNMGNLACGTQLPARLYVEENEPFPNVDFHAAIGGVTLGNNLPQTHQQYGVVGNIEGTTSGFGWHAGVYGASRDASNQAVGGNQSWGVGVMGEASGPFETINVGVLGIADQDDAFDNIGVYGIARNADRDNFAGYFAGDVRITGSGWINGGLWGGSDRKLKTNIDSLRNSLAIIKQLKPSTYYMLAKNSWGLNLPSAKQYGFIAQDVEKVLPELVKSAFNREMFDSTGKKIQDSVTYKGVNYIEIIPILTAAMQEQQRDIDKKQDEINSLNTRLTELERCISQLGLCNTRNNLQTPANEDGTQRKLGGSTAALQIKLGDPQSIVLNQNVPNPFAEKTSISFSIPASVKLAKIVFFNQEGKQINTVDIKDRGQGTLNVYADDLSSGIYIYTLIADDVVIETKRMVKF